MRDLSTMLSCIPPPAGGSHDLNAVLAFALAVAAALFVMTSGFFAIGVLTRYLRRLLEILPKPPDGVRERTSSTRRWLAKVAALSVLALGPGAALVGIGVFFVNRTLCNGWAGVN